MQSISDTRWECGLRSSVELLVEHGADITLTNTDGKSAAMLAEEEGHHDISKYLSELVAT